MYSFLVEKKTPIGTHVYQRKHYWNSFDNTENLVSVVKYALTSTTQSIFPLFHTQISAVVYFE